MLRKAEKTGISESAIAAFVTSVALGILPFFELDIDMQQATHLGFVVAPAAVWVLRQLHKRRGA